MLPMRKAGPTTSIPTSKMDPKIDLPLPLMELIKKGIVTKEWASKLGVGDRQFLANQDVCDLIAEDIIKPADISKLLTCHVFAIQDDPFIRQLLRTGTITVEQFSALRYNELSSLQDNAIQEKMAEPELQQKLKAGLLTLSSVIASLVEKAENSLSGASRSKAKFGGLTAYSSSFSSSGSSSVSSAFSVGDKLSIPITFRRQPDRYLSLTDLTQSGPPALPSLEKIVVPTDKPTSIQRSIVKPFISTDPNSLGQYIVVAAGPGGKAFSPETVALVASNIAKQGSSGVACFHDGRDGQMTVMKDAIGALTESAKTGGSTTLFVMAHGEAVQGEFHLDLDGIAVSGKTFFQSISTAIEKPINIFLTCHAGTAALNNAKYLPAGSTVVALSDWDSVSAHSDLDRLYSALDTSENLSAKSLLLLHCTVMQNRTPNFISINGQSYGLEAYSECMAGHKFTKEERTKIHDQLDKLIAPKDRIRIDQVIELLEKKAYISAKDYGLTLAIAGALYLP